MIASIHDRLRHSAAASDVGMAGLVGKDWARRLTTHPQASVSVENLDRQATGMIARAPNGTLGSGAKRDKMPAAPSPARAGLHVDAETSMDVDSFFDRELDEHAAVLAATRSAVRQPFARLLRLCVLCCGDGGKLVFFGNGGSAADAQHLATELTVRYHGDRAPIPALALTTDTSALTAIGNDLGFERLFARQVEAVCRAGDVCIGISTSGESENVVRGLAAARQRGCVAAALTGGDGGRLTAIADPVLVVPSRVTARIQEMHITLGQMLCAALERELGLA